MSREEDDAYFENFSPLDDQSRPPPRVVAPASQPRTQPPRTYTPPAQQPSADDRYFRGFSVMDQGERYPQEAPTVQIPREVMNGLITAAAPPAPSAPPTQVTYDAHGAVKKITGQLDVPPSTGAISDDAYFSRGVPVYDHGGRNSASRLVPDSVIGQLGAATNQRPMGMQGQPNNGGPSQSGVQPNNSPNRGGWSR